MSNALYTAIATSTGDARAGGHTVTDDGLLDVTLAIPRSMGGPGGATNPEQLFAAGWASCFHSALKLVAAQQKIFLTDTTVVAEVSIVSAGQNAFTLAGALRVHIGGDTPKDTASTLVDAAHQVCPYSNATRGNIPVTITTTTNTNTNTL